MPHVYGRTYPCLQWRILVCDLCWTEVIFLLVLWSVWFGILFFSGPWMGGGMGRRVRSVDKEKGYGGGIRTRNKGGDEEEG